MKVDPERIGESKRDFRRRLAARPIAEKLRLLDSLRQRALAIRRRSNTGATKKALSKRRLPTADLIGGRNQHPHSAPGIRQRAEIRSHLQKGKIKKRGNGLPP